MITNWQNLHKYWKLVLIVLTLVVFGLGVYASVQCLQIRAQLQYVDLTIKPPRLADKRILLTSTNSTELLAGIDNCDKLGALNNDPPDRTVKYRNTDIGLEFDVPYNPKWGSEKYKVNPYDEDKNKYTASPYPFNVNIRFGPIECYTVKSIDTFVSVTRTYGLSIERTTDEEKIIQSSKVGRYIPIIEKRNIGGLITLLLKFNGYDDCQEKAIMVGKKYSYQILGSLCDNAETTYKKFLPILGSVKLIE